MVDREDQVAIGRIVKVPETESRRVLDNDGNCIDQGNSSCG